MSWDLFYRSTPFLTVRKIEVCRSIRDHYVHDFPSAIVLEQPGF